ncbi:MAG TPA: BON domain-containing protein [Ktedonobacterales bacterium]
MEYARQEVRFASGGWSGSTLVTGIVTSSSSPGARRLAVRGLAVRAADSVVTHTLLGRLRRRDTLPSEAQAAGDGRSELPEGVVRLVRGLSVRQGKAKVGTLTAVWCDRATARVMHALVQSSGGLFSRHAERVVAASQISQWTPSGLVLDPDVVFAALSPYVPDATIAMQARGALSGVLLAPSARQAVKLRVEEGEVYLSGTVGTEEQAAAARRMVERIRGVRGLVMDLVAAESLGAHVEQALTATLAANAASDTSGDATRPAMGNVRVLSEHGIVYLEGSVPTRELSAALERAARAVPGVRVVMNSLIVEVDAPALPPPSGTSTSDGEAATVMRASRSTVRLPTPR